MGVEVKTTVESGSHPIPGCIKTACGRAKYAELASRKGALARLRLAWFVAIAALRDWKSHKKAPRKGA